MALIKYRIKTEIVYLKHLSQSGIIGMRKFTAEEEKILDDVYNITEEDALTVKKSQLQIMM